MLHVILRTMRWADDRNLIKGSTPKNQLKKLIEEVMELAEEIKKDDFKKAKVELGDCLVVLTILSAQMGYSMEECLIEAYEKIKDRKGKMIDGVFVKEEDIILVNGKAKRK